MVYNKKHRCTALVFLSVISAFKYRSDFFKIFSDRKMLRTDFLTFAAFQAFGSLSMPMSGDYVTVIEERVVAVEGLEIVHRRKQIRDTDLHGAFALFDAVTAGSAGYQIQALEDFPHFHDGFLLFFGQRLEILHGGDVVFHLLHAAHS